MSGVVSLPHNNGNIPVKGLKSYAFQNMAITSVVIPAQYDKNTYGAFANCSDLTTVSFENNSALSVLHQETFIDCSSLSSITLPSSLTKIDIKCFEGCASLVIITIPDSVTAISSWVFKNCSSLTTVNISSTSRLTSFGENVFLNSGLAAITLPHCFEGNNPFADTTITVDYYPE